MVDKSPEQFVEFEVTSRVRTTPERYKNFLDMMREVAVEPLDVHIVDSEGANMLFRLPEKSFDTEIVTLEELHHFRKHHTDDETPNAISTVAFNRLAAGLPQDVKIFDRKKNLIGVQTPAFMERARRIIDGEDEDVTGTKTVGFIRGALGYLEAKQSQKKKPE